MPWPAIKMTGYLLTAVLGLTQTAGALAQSARVGASLVAITPLKGTPMAGYYHERGAQGTHDELFARAIVIEAGGTRAALVALDLISTTRDLVEEARREIEATGAVRGDAVMISATHAHTGPVIRGRGAIDLVVGGESVLARDFRSTLPKKIAEAVRLAESRLQSASILVGHGHEASIAFNRRYHMADGTVGWNPGKRNPNILKPAGTIDPDVAVVYCESLDHRPIAAYVNYAVHLDNVGGQFFSADVPFTLSKLLADAQGTELVTVFTAGCCGDVNHIDVNWSRPQGGFGNAARMGTILAAEVLRTWPRFQPLRAGPVRSKSTTVRLALPEVSADQATAAHEVVARRIDPKAPQPNFLAQVEAFKVLDVVAQNGRPWEVEIQVVAIGDELAWVSLPGEIFVELGLAIKQDSPFPHTVIAELANGAIGYIPSRRAYAQGNYEVVSAAAPPDQANTWLTPLCSCLKRCTRKLAPQAPARLVDHSVCVATCPLT